MTIRKFNSARYVAAYATADWLIGHAPRAVHSYGSLRRTIISDGRVRYATSFSELTPCESVAMGRYSSRRLLEARPIARDQAFVALSGLSATRAYRFPARYLPLPPETPLNSLPHERADVPTFGSLVTWPQPGNRVFSNPNIHSKWLEVW
jgi:hypothetical protein